MDKSSIKHECNISHTHRTNGDSSARIDYNTFCCVTYTAIRFAILFCLTRWCTGRKIGDPGSPCSCRNLMLSHRYKPSSVHYFSAYFAISTFFFQTAQNWFSAMYPTSDDMSVALSISTPDTGRFFVGELNGRMIASAAANPVADDIFHASYFYVAENYR